jgi:hypothetical protein
MAIMKVVQVISKDFVSVYHSTSFAGQDSEKKSGSDIRLQQMTGFLKNDNSSDCYFFWNPGN